MGHNKPLNDREKQILDKVSKHDSPRARLEAALDEAEADLQAVVDRFKAMRPQWIDMVLGDGK